MSALPVTLCKCLLHFVKFVCRVKVAKITYLSKYLNTELSASLQDDFEVSQKMSN